MEARLGHKKSKANHGLPMPAMVATIKVIKQQAISAETPREANYLLKVGAYLTICTAALIRGYEGFYLDLNDLRKHQETGREGVIPKKITSVRLFSKEECRQLPHVVLPLRGKFKGDVGVDTHMVNVAS